MKKERLRKLTGLLVLILLVVLLAGCGSKSKDKKDADITLGGKSFNEVVTKVSNYAIKHNSADTVAASKQELKRSIKQFVLLANQYHFRLDDIF